MGRDDIPEAIVQLMEQGLDLIGDNAFLLEKKSVRYECAFLL